MKINYTHPIQRDIECVNRLKAWRTLPYRCTRKLRPQLRHSSTRTPSSLTARKDRPRARGFVNALLKVRCLVFVITLHYHSFIWLSCVFYLVPCIFSKLVVDSIWLMFHTVFCWRSVFSYFPRSSIWFLQWEIWPIGAWAARQRRVPSGRCTSSRRTVSRLRPDWPLPHQATPAWVRPCSFSNI